MNLDKASKQAQLSSMLYHDNSALAHIKNNAHSSQALETVAGQFEAMFLQLVLRQMRSSSDVLAAEDSPFSSQQQGMFRDMYDGQVAIELTKRNNTGIADMLIKQLSPAMQDTVSHLSSRFSASNDADAGEKAKPAEEEKNRSERNRVNSEFDAVALVKQVLSESGMTSAFSQPLIKKMEL